MAARVDPFLGAFLAASVAHAAVFAIVRGSLDREPQSASTVEPRALTVELIDIEIPAARAVSVEPPPEAIVASAKGATPTRGQARSRTERVGPAPFRTNAPAAEDQPEIHESSDPPAEAPTAVTTEPAGTSASFSREQLGLDGPNRLSHQAFDAVAPRAAERVSRAMRRLAHEHDRKLGLGAGGPVATALQKAAYQGDGTLDGQATFEVVVIDNVVSSISLALSNAEKQSAWNEVAKNALAQLSGRHVHTPTRSRGVVLHIQVVSRAALPSGHDPGIEISVGPLVVQRGRGKRSARLEFLPPAVVLTSVVDFPGALGGGSVPAPGVRATLVRTDIDPVDLRATDRQVVQASTVDETPFD